MTCQRGRLLSCSRRSDLVRLLHGVKPFQVLSNGEQFRCHLARSLARGMTSEEAMPLVVMDEFTSVVDRNVAKIASAAINKGIRKGNLPCQFVAISCHYDITEWLAPDWVLDMATCELSRRSLRRPSIELEIHRCRVEAWRLFARHHYLAGTLAPQTRCYLATWTGEPVAFAATLPVISKKGHRRFSRNRHVTRLSGNWHRDAFCRCGGSAASRGRSAD